MKADVISKLLEDVLEECHAGLNDLAVVGRAADVRQFAAALHESLGFSGRLELFANDLSVETGGVKALKDIVHMRPGTVVIVEDDDKEAVVTAILGFMPRDAAPKVLVAGYEHYRFRDSEYQAIVDGLLVPSIANGYSNCLVHIFQCLKHAARLGLEGCVAEFGVYKGGTTRFIAEVVASLGCAWPVYGFDTFEGFPKRRSMLDMYDHKGAEYSRLSLVQQYLSDTGVQLVQGDIVDTACILRGKDMVLTFVDTDNYSSARAGISEVVDGTVVGGAIVLDHFTGENRFRYTLGERMAANELLVSDARYFNLYGTGVFIRTAAS